MKTKNPLQTVRTLLLNGFIIVLTFFMIQACDDDDDDNGPTGPNGDANLAEVAQDNSNLSEFVSNLEDAGELSTLEGDGPLTVFAPNNDAFNALSGDTADSELLTYHIVESDIASGDLEAEQTVASQAGSLYVTSNGEVAVNDSATVVEADIEASNGRIHIIDHVVRPDSQSDVVGIIVKRYNLQSLQDSLTQAGLTDTLQEDTDAGYTVFAPTNTAFEGADLGGQDSESVLRYHVLTEEMTSENLMDGDAQTLSGETVEIVTANGEISLVDQNEDTVTVTTTDLQGTNGVVHLTDGVLNAAASDTTDGNGGEE